VAANQRVHLVEIKKEQELEKDPEGKS